MEGRLWAAAAVMTKGSLAAAFVAAVVWPAAGPTKAAAVKVPMPWVVGRMPEAAVGSWWEEVSLAAGPAMAAAELVVSDWVVGMERESAGGWLAGSWLGVASWPAGRQLAVVERRAVAAGRVAALVKAGVESWKPVAAAAAAVMARGWAAGRQPLVTRG